MFEDWLKVNLPVLTVAVVILPALLYWQYWRWTHRRMLELAKLLPGPPALPIIGNALIFMTKPEEQLKKIAGLLELYGQYVRVWLGPDLNIVVKNPADVRLLLTSNKVNQKGPLYDFMKPFIGPGILTGGPSWRNHRKIANPSYSKKSVQHYAAVFNREASELVRVLLKKDPGATFDLYYDMVECTTQCVCQTLMGLSKEDSQNVLLMDDVVNDTRRIYDILFQKMTRWWLQIPLINWLTGNLRIEKQLLRKLDRFTEDIVEKRRRVLKTEGAGDEEVMGIVDRYLLSGELTDQEIKWETFTLFTTSQEASAKIASGVLLFLALLPEWQDKVYNEIVDLLGADDEPVTEKQVKALQQLDLVYKETLRYFSIAAMTQRTVVEEITINDGKITLPAGTSLVIPIHEIHRDPRYWEQPLQVQPERFLPENVALRDPNAFVPFSLGAMDCLGRVYATALIKILVVRVLRALRLEARGAPGRLRLRVAISVAPADGYLLRVRPRRPSCTVHTSL